ncbi:MAG: amino acid permease [Ignavibacteria bacterium]|nr:amino acid permease [Ignavibacteria bacterium]MBT8383361.1 amino acid permease [Ignavibacteria bacterium]MBT8390387.1 amino acid permease [Ignavibacteria bacterium]NNJ52737.1 amino acid permease [Ignavibacteriaceae bacterium]NNL21632.1 amino acid permease [Ignavibacteriaceae bacterium]
MFEKKRLKKELSLFHVYAIATGTTLSAGFFLLPGIAAAEAGQALPLVYIIAVIPLIPAMLSIIELATAIPRAGGVYYFLDRTMGPMIGTIGGIGTWLALVLKVAFALIGMGAYVHLFFPKVEIIPFAIITAFILGLFGLFGAKRSGHLQIFLVSFLLIFLLIFVTGGVPQIDKSHFQNFFSSGWGSILSAAGLVYISYVGVTNIASLSEEVKDPERNLPLGIFLAIGTAVVIYTFGTAVMVGVLPIDKLMGNFTPVASAGEVLFGKFGVIALSIAAMIAFISVANGGTLAASRYPLALSRDHLIPGIFQKLSRWGTPFLAIFSTVAIIVLILLFLDPTKIAKLASAFQLMVFSFICLAVIIIRESKIEAYDPGFKSPLYPWLHLLGIILPYILIYQMGILPLLFSLGLILLGGLWYWYYARKKVVRSGAIYHLFERLGRSRFDGLDIEMRGILKEKGLRESDPFDEIVIRSHVIDYHEKDEFNNAVRNASEWISQFVEERPQQIEKQFLDGTRMGATPVTHGIALPHLRLSGLEQAEMVLVRGRNGIHIKYKDPMKDLEHEEEAEVNAIFFLVSPQKDPTQHLRILAQIAGRVEEGGFAHEWQDAKDDQEIKEALLHEDRSLSLIIDRETASKDFIGKALKEVKIPDDCLVAILRRAGQTIVPKGNTIIEEGDRITIIGAPKGMTDFKKKFGGIY